MPAASHVKGFLGHGKVCRTQIDTIYLTACVIPQPNEENNKL